MHAAPLSQPGTATVGTPRASVMGNQPERGFCQYEALQRVGAALHAAPELSDDELEIHIEDCQHLYLMAYERFLAYGCPHDRDDALLHLHRMNVAILSRSPAAQAVRHAAFERRLADGIDYFAARGLADRAAMERTSA
jgi:hypothetical protein